MLESTSVIVCRFVAILRCRTWCRWPEWERFQSQAFQDPIVTASGVKVFLSLHIVTYKDRPRPENAAAAKLDIGSGPILWRGTDSVGYWVGGARIKAPEDQIILNIGCEPPYEGEIDLQLHVGCEQEVSSAELSPIIESILQSALAFVNLAVNEIMVPVAPVQLIRLLAAGNQIASSTNLAVRARHAIAEDNAAHTVKQFAVARSTQSIKEAEALGVASRRLMSAISETDDVDRYCDYWETCEFATLFKLKARGGLVGRIAQALTDQLLTIFPDLTKARTENALELRLLHAIRGRVVHEAFDAPGRLQGNLALLGEIASELLRHGFKLPPQPGPRIMARLSEK
jgi:galactitol-specific phosphotransferase system IIB component